MRAIDRNDFAQEHAMVEFFGWEINKQAWLGKPVTL